MSHRVLLISEEAIKNESIIESNVDNKVLQKVILAVQEIQLKPILGTELYNALLIDVKNAVSDNTHTLSEYHSTLLHEYITPWLINETVSEFIVINNYKLSNKGMVRLNDNSVSTSTPQDIEYVKNFYDNYAATYKARLINHLRKDADNTTGGTYRNTTSTGIGWWLEPYDEDCNI